MLRVKGIGLSTKTIDQVEPLLDAAVRGWSDLNPRSLEYAEALTMLGMVRQFAADLDLNTFRTNVEPLYKRALNVYDRSTVPPDPASLALTLELEAAALNFTGQVEEATFLSERAVTIRKERVRELQEGGKRIGSAFKPGTGITAPTIASRAESAYTNEARFLQIKGSVGLRFVVDENGQPQDILLTHSLGYGLDENAALAVRAWRYFPGKDDAGKPVPTIVDLELPFKPEK